MKRVFCGIAGRSGGQCQAGEQSPARARGAEACRCSNVNNAKSAIGQEKGEVRREVRAVAMQVHGGPLMNDGAEGTWREGELQREDTGFQGREIDNQRRKQGQDYQCKQPERTDCGQDWL